MTPVEVAAVISALPADARARIGHIANRAMSYWLAERKTEPEIRRATVAALEVAVIAEGGLRLIGRVRS